MEKDIGEKRTDPKKGGSDSEPSRGRLQQSRQAERAFFRLRRSKEAGGWRIFCHGHKKTPEQCKLFS